MRYANLIDSQSRKDSVNALSSLNLDSLLTGRSAIHRAIGKNNRAMNRAPTESDVANPLSGIKSSLTLFNSGGGWTCYTPTNGVTVI